MDRERLDQLEQQCIQDRPPACTAACPVHVDARELAATASRRDLAAARTGVRAGRALPACHRSLLRRPVRGGVRARTGGRQHPHPRPGARGHGSRRRRGAGRAAGQTQPAGSCGGRGRRTEWSQRCARALAQGLRGGRLRGKRRRRRTCPRTRRGGAATGRARGRHRAGHRRRGAVRPLHFRRPGTAAWRCRPVRSGARRRRHLSGRGRRRGRCRRCPGLRRGRPGSHRRRPGHARHQQAWRLRGGQHAAPIVSLVADHLDSRRPPSGPVGRPAAPGRLPWRGARGPWRLWHRADRRPGRRGSRGADPASLAL